MNCVIVNRPISWQRFKIIANCVNEVIFRSNIPDLQFAIWMRLRHKQHVTDSSWPECSLLTTSESKLMILAQSCKTDYQIKQLALHEHVVDENTSCSNASSTVKIKAMSFIHCLSARSETILPSSPFPFIQIRSRMDIFSDGRCCFNYRQWNTLSAEATQSTH